MKQLSLLSAIALLILASCRNSTPASTSTPDITEIEIVEDTTTPPERNSRASTDTKLESEGLYEMIVSSLEANDYKFRVTYDENGIRKIEIGFNGENGDIDMKITVDPNRNYYVIAGSPDFTIKESTIGKWMIALNDYNISSGNVCACVTGDREIMFWQGRNTEHGAFSRKAFEVDFNQVYTAIDEDILDIIKDIRSLDSLTETSFTPSADNYTAI